MKKLFSRDDSKFLLSLLLFIVLLTIRSGKYTYIVNILFFISLFIYYRTGLSKMFLGIFYFTVWVLFPEINSFQSPKILLYFLHSCFYSFTNHKYIRT